MIVGNRIAADLPRILVPAAEEPALIRFAVKMARAQQAALLAVYVHHQTVNRNGHLSRRAREAMSFAEDDRAHAAFQLLRQVCAEAQVPLMLIYTLHGEPGDVLLDHAATWGVEAIVMGASRKREPLPVPAQPLLRKVYHELPASIPLLIHT